MKQASGWPDSVALTEQNLVLGLDDGGFVRVDVLGERLFRVRHAKSSQWTESALNRYGILTSAFADVAFQQTEGNGLSTIATEQARLAISRKDGAISLTSTGGKLLTRQDCAGLRARRAL